MTANQMILLFDCYRGFRREVHVGTLSYDVACLKGKGFLQDGEHREYEVTTLGRQTVEALLLVLS